MTSMHMDTAHMYMSLAGLNSPSNRTSLGETITVVRLSER